jgi:hypothetical protein
LRRVEIDTPESYTYDGECLKKAEEMGKPVGLCTSRIQLTHSLEPPDFNPCACKVKTGFKLCFPSSTCRYKPGLVHIRAKQDTFLFTVRGILAVQLCCSNAVDPQRALKAPPGFRPKPP